MAQVLSKLTPISDPRLLVGINTADDAGVFLVEPGLALVQTVDMLTPMVEDPYTFGRIAATNSLSDVYAMGGTPLTALNIAGFPAPAPKDWLAEILRGGQDAVVQAGAVVAGGHTFNEKEIKYGLSVTGRIRPDRIVTNARCRAGDVLLLTKPLGCGTFIQAVMTQDVVDDGRYRAATGSMATLTWAAAEAMVECGASAATDITGYGFLGHAQEMAEGSGKALEFRAAAIPLLPGVLELAEAGLEDPGVAMNQSSFASKVTLDPALGEGTKRILWESQTSGGLLVSLAEQEAGRFQRLAADKGVSAAVIGRVLDGPAGTVLVRP